MAPRSTLRRLAEMSLFILAGIILAIAHHLSSDSLSEESADEYSQTWIKYAGIAAAFLVKCSFSSAIGIAVRESLWLELRRRPTKISSLDKLFTVQQNVFSFFSKDAFKTAPWALLLSAIQWLTFLAALFPPGTLNIQVATRETIKSNCRVPTFVETFGRTWFPGGFGRKINNTPDLDRWSYETVIPGRINFVPSSEFCATNCSYVQTFVAPNMTCQTPERGDVTQDILAPNPDDPSRCDLRNETACTIFGSPVIPNPSNTTVDKTFNVTYATSYRNETGSKYLLNMNYSRLICTYSHVQYKLNVTYINDDPKYDVTMTPFTIPDNYQADFKTEPKEKDQDNWDLEVTAFALFKYFHIMVLQGHIQLFRYPWSGDNLKLTLESGLQYTSLIDDIETDFVIHPTQDLATSIPALFQNFTISTFAIDPNNTNATTCTLRTTSPVYHYNPIGLVIPYGVAAFLSIVCAGIGFASLSKSGAPVRPIFSQLLGATRNESLGTVVKEKADGRLKILEERSLKLGDGNNHPSVFVVGQESEALASLRTLSLPRNIRRTSSYDSRDGDNKG